MSRNARKGIVLILASGLLTAIALLGALFLRVSRFSASVEDARRQQILASLAAESGLSYAAGRLSNEIGYPPSGALTENRGDDWTFRDGLETPLPDAANVSYGHGEAWRETGGDPGAYDAGLDDVSSAGAWTDLDGDGKFSAWSGRLRGESGGIGSPFALKIVSPGGLFPVNFISSAGESALARFGDNLGAVLLPDGSAPERVDRASTAGGKTGEPIRISALGRHLIFGEDISMNGVPDPGEDINGNGNVFERRRPFGGYATLDEVREQLAYFGYSPAVIEKVIPYIDLGPYETPAGSGKWPGGTAMVNLSTAPPEVLQAFWLYASWFPSDELLTYADAGSSPGGSSGSSGTGSGGPAGPGGVGGGAGSGSGPTFSEWLGSAYGSAGSRCGGGVPYTQASVMIYPDEAEGLSKWAKEFRATGERASWLAFRKSLCARARPDTLHVEGPLFAADTEPLLSAGWTEAAYAWARAKADAAFFAACPEGGKSNLSPRTWDDWGIDPGPGAAPPGGIRHFLGVHFKGVEFLFPAPAATGAWPDSPYQFPTITEGINSGSVTHALTLAPPVAYTVETVARSGRARARGAGRFRAAEHLEFSSQEDFENTLSPSRWSRRGITVLDFPSPGGRNQRRREVFDAVDDLVNGGFVGPPAPFRGAVTGPGFNPNGIRSSFGSGVTVASSTAGFIGLAGRYTGNQGAYVSWQMQPDDVVGTNSAPDAEWKTQTRGTSPTSNPPNPPVYPGLEEVKAANPWTFGFSNGSPSSTASPPSSSASGTITPGTCTCWPFDFDPITNGDQTAGMQSFSVELWTSGYGNVFLLEGDAVASNGAASLISIQITRQADRDASSVSGCRYTARFQAPASSIPQVANAAPMGVKGWADDGVYEFDLDAFVPGVEIGAVHVVLTLENLKRGEDMNGNGAVDDWEDWNGDGDVVDPANAGPDFPGQDLRNELTLTLYVDGKKVGTATDLDGLKKHLKNSAWMKKGRAYPSFPYPMSQETMGKRITYFVFSGDELRLYDKGGVKRASGVADADGDGLPDEVLKEPDALERWRLGRFYQPQDSFPSKDNPEFFSPMYFFDPPATVVCAGWTGIPTSTPSGGQERVGIHVKVGIPNAGPPLRVDGPVLNPTEQVTPGEAFSSMGPAQTLGYTVEFSNLQPGNSQPIFETPLFEGVWIQIRRRGHSPAWIARD